MTSSPRPAGQINIAFSFVVDSAIPAAIEILGEPASSNTLTLRIARAGANIILSWDAPGYVLQETTELGQTWTTLSDAFSPLTVSPTGADRFYRLMK